MQCEDEGIVNLRCKDSGWTAAPRGDPLRRVYLPLFCRIPYTEVGFLCY